MSGGFHLISETNFGSGHHAGCCDAVRATHGFAALDLVDIFHALGDLAPNGVLLVEEAGIIEADEKLRIRGIRILRTRHGADAADMRLGVEFSLDIGIIGTTHASAIRTAGLRHEAIDHTVEDDAIVELLSHQLLDMGNMAGCKIRAHGNDHAAFGCFKDKGIFWLAHARSSCLGFNR